MNSQPIHKKMKSVGPLLFIFLLFALCAISLPALAVPYAPSTPPSLHLPFVEESPVSPSGFKTTWSCVWFGNYPSEEVVQSNWDLVNDEALSDGDVIISDELYGQLSQAEWRDDVTELEGVSYLRVGLNSSPSPNVIREQHYNFSADRPWHYFKISPIRWRVLDIKDDKALLLADRMPDSVPFHEVDEDVTWDECTLRSWLNGYGAAENKQGIAYTGNGFIDRAFTEKEKKSILPTLLENLPNQDYSTSSGQDTEDRLFLLSNADVFEGENALIYGFEPSRNYNDPAKRFTSTLYAKCMGAWWSPVDAYLGNSFWFMRTNGYTPHSVTYVCDFGYIYSKGTLVNCSDAGVLPAMWVDLSLADLTGAEERISTEIIRDSDEKGILEAPEIGNPTIIVDETQPGGEYTVWNAVTFGSYPQTEIVETLPENTTSDEQEADPVLWQKLQTAAGSPDSKEEVIVDGKRYIHLEERWFRFDPIIWRVLESTNGEAFLMADRGLDTVPYNEEYTDVFWENSDLRNWLNTSFMEQAFTKEEAECIILSDVDNKSNYYFGTACGSGTHDKVFVLSEAEVFCGEKAKTYGFRPSDEIADSGRRIKPTAYALARGAWQSQKEETANTGFWILRTNGYTRDNVVYVGEKGYLYNRGIPVTCADATIVPAIRVTLGRSHIQRADDISWYLDTF